MQISINMCDSVSFSCIIQEKETVYDVCTREWSTFSDLKFTNTQCKCSLVPILIVLSTT